VERFVQTDEGDVYVDSPMLGLTGSPPEVNEKYENQKITKSFFVPKLCNQCEKPPCVQVCPVSATFKTDDGIILVNRDKCIGCRYCIQACPYGSRYQTHTSTGHKCTW
jgi:Fe-S-cluster-containing dehydrogenase component